MGVRRLGRGLAAAALVAMGIGLPLREATAAGTIAVTTTADINGVCPSVNQCSLRTAVIQGQTLSMDVAVPAGTYNLTIADENSSVGDGTKGDLDISGTVVVTGAGSGITIINGGGINRIFDIGTTGNLTVSGVSLRNGFGTTGVVGHQHGANIHNHGALTLSNAAIIGGVAGPGWGGGGLTHASSATSTVVRNVSFGGNRGSNGAAIEVFGAAAGDLQLDHVTVVGNQATAAGGGLYTGNNAARVKVSNSLFVGNTPANCDGTLTNLNGNMSTDASCAGFRRVPSGGLIGLSGPRDQYPLAPNSLAIDAAADTAGTDQLGNPAADGNGDGVIVRDVGASEAPQNTLPATDLAIRERLFARGNPVAPGGTLRLTAFVVNRSAQAATVSRILFTLPAGVTFVRSETSFACEASGPAVLCELGTINPGPFPALVEIRVAVSSAVPVGSNLVATASVTSANPELRPADNSSSATIIVG